MANLYDHYEVTLDRENDLGYISFGNSPIIRSVESNDGLFVLDYTTGNTLAGIEILSLTMLMNSTDDVEFLRGHQLTKATARRIIGDSLSHA